MKKFKWTYTTENGKKGYLVTGPNNNSIFLPAAGGRYKSSLLNIGELGCYWSSTSKEDNVEHAFSLLFLCSGDYTGLWYGRYNGQSVRPVSE